MKVAVYTIALNEAANAERWAESARDADYRLVADTGSTDGTVELLEAAGVTVHRISIQPWRFDLARNAAMALIPADSDICCTMDMDRSLESGWREELELAWGPDTTALFNRVAYRTAHDSPDFIRSFQAKNFHHRRGYRFTRAVHEALSYSGIERTANSNVLTMTEVQDQTKDTRRQYLPLMELAHSEDPDDGQICFWLGRDYMHAGRASEAAALFERYVALPSSTWGEERSEAMRYLARVQPDRKMFWLDRARAEASHRREVWLDIAEQFHDDGDWLNLFWACANGINKTVRTNSYLDDGHSWGFRLYDLGAIAAWRLNNMDQAVAWGQQAFDLDPSNDRLRSNQEFFARHREEVRAG